MKWEGWFGEQYTDQLAGFLYFKRWFLKPENIGALKYQVTSYIVFSQYWQHHKGAWKDKSCF